MSTGEKPPPDATILQRKDGDRDSSHVILSLPFLSLTKVELAFHELRLRKNTERLAPLFEYIQTYWMSGIWEPTTWNVHRRVGE